MKIITYIISLWSFDRNEIFISGDKMLCKRCPHCSWGYLEDPSLYQYCSIFIPKWPNFKSSIIQIVLSYDNNIIIPTSIDNVDDLLLNLKFESELVFRWFKENQMVVSLDKFSQAIILQNAINIRNCNPVKLEIGSTQIKATNRKIVRNHFR